MAGLARGGVGVVTAIVPDRTGLVHPGPDMPLASARRLCVPLAMLVFATSCGRSPPAAVVPASAAYSDGFQVVVFDLRDGAPSGVRSLPLREAERALAAGAQARIPDDADAIERSVPTSKSGDTRVMLAMERLDGGRQRVRVSFHYSLRTFVYEYEVDQSRVTPLGSEYHDLSRDNRVRYLGEWSSS